MGLTVNGYSVVFITLITFLTSLILVPFVKKIATHVGALDMPNERKVHKEPMPRMGGLAIFAAFLLGYMLFARTSIQMLSILIGGFIIVLTGIVDDIKPIRARTKLLMQVVAASIVVFYGDIVLDYFNIFGFDIYFITPINYIVTIIFIVAIMNAINFIDGLDGLAAGLSSIYFLTIAIIAFILNRNEGLDTILSLIMLGSTLGFLVHNFNPAKIFMGDTGSLFLGFTISVIALLGFKATTVTSLIVPLIILAIPIFDTLLAILRRILKGESIGAPDKDHLHHQLLKMKFSVKSTVLIIYAIDLLFASISIFYVLGDAKIAMYIYVALMLLLLFLVIKTDILFLHNKDKKCECCENHEEHNVCNDENSLCDCDVDEEVIANDKEEMEEKEVNLEIVSEVKDVSSKTKKATNKRKSKSKKKKKNKK